MLYSEVTCQRTGHMLRIWSTLALEVTLIYSSHFSYMTAMNCMVKETAKSGILLLSFQDAQMRKPS